MPSRPEHEFPPEIYYNEDEAKKYDSSSRIFKIQTSMAERAIELLNLPSDQSLLLLDIGCGSGISSYALEEKGHYVIGVDISKAMLDIALERELESTCLINLDIGYGLNFRPGTFDGAISISTIQWLCYNATYQQVVKRLYTFFSSLYSCLSRGSKAVFQFYPENTEQLELIYQQSLKAGFTGGLVVDYPHSTKAKKMYLVLFTGGTNKQLPMELSNIPELNQVSNNGIASRKEVRKPLRGKPVKKSRQWILEKKERRRRQGKEVRNDTIYTGRKRSGRF